MTAPSAASTALLTDRYELTMLDAALQDGTAARPSVFEVFTRRLPAGRRYGVVAGVARVVDALAAFRFDDDVLRWLEAERVVGPTTLRWLADFRFRGDVHAYREGEPHFGGSPVMTVVAPFGEALVIETLVLSILNHDSAIAAAAARMVSAAGGRRLLEFGSRRTHEEAAVAAARSAALVGFDATSNLEAGRRYGIPTAGTTGHAFVLAHDDERAAFASQVTTTGPATTLLVDTYDTASGLETALDVAGADLGGVRIDSGDLADEARRARSALDAAGATGARVVVSGDLDEHAIAALADAPVDAYGVGTSLVTGSGAPTVGLRLQAGRPRRHARRPDGASRQGRRGEGDRRTVEGRVAQPHRRGRDRGAAATRGDAAARREPPAADRGARAGRGRRGRRPAGRARPTTERRSPSFRPPRSTLAPGEPCLPTVHLDPDPPTP